MSSPKRTPREDPGRAILARVNRAIAANNRQVRRSHPGSADRKDLGRFYVVDQTTETVVDRQVDLVAFARSLGVLTPYGRRRARAKERRGRGEKTITPADVCGVGDCGADSVAEFDGDSMCVEHLMGAMQESESAPRQVEGWLNRQVMMGWVDVKERKLVERLVEDLKSEDYWGWSDAS